MVNAIKKKYIGIGVCLLVVICIAVAGIIFFNKPKPEELDINSEEVWELYIPFRVYNSDADKEELYKSDIVTPDKLSDEYKNRMAYAKYLFVTRDLENNEYMKLPSSKLEKYYKELFGKDVKYVAKSFDSLGVGSAYTRYNEKKDIYTPELSGGDVAYFSYKTQIYKALKIGETIELYQYVAVSNLKLGDDDKGTETAYGLFANIEDATAFTNSIQISDNEGGLYNIIDYKFNAELVEANLNEYKDKASKYKITLEEENGNYIFKQIDKIEE